MGDTAGRNSALCSPHPTPNSDPSTPERSSACPSLAPSPACTRESPGFSHSAPPPALLLAGNGCWSLLPSAPTQLPPTTCPPLPTAPSTSETQKEQKVSRHGEETAEVAAGASGCGESHELGRKSRGTASPRTGPIVLGLSPLLLPRTTALSGSRKRTISSNLSLLETVTCFRESWFSGSEGAESVWKKNH